MSKPVCSICGYGTNTERGLKIHLSRVHTEEERSAMDATSPSEKPETSDPVEEEASDTEGSADPVAESVEDFFEETPESSTDLPFEESFSETLSPSQLGIKSVPIGASVSLSGTFWWKDPDSNTYENKEAVDIPCTVDSKLNQQGYVYLQLSSDCGDWCCLEQSVLDGSVTLLSLKTVVEAETAVDTADSVEDDFDPFAEVPEESSVEPVEEETSTEDSRPDLSEYNDACDMYAQARDAKNRAADHYKKVDEQVRPVILDFLEKNGSETSEGSGDLAFKDDKYRVHYSFTPGKVSIKRDEKAIIEWCLQNGHFYAIKSALDVAVWESLVEKGVVPDSLLQEVHTPVKGKDDRRLLITPVISSDK